MILMFITQFLLTKCRSLLLSNFTSYLSCIILEIATNSSLSKIALILRKKLNNFIFHAFCLFLFSTNDGGQATFDHNIYSTLHGGGMPFHGGGMHKSSKNSSAALSALTLLAFLFFLNLLQSCMKEHITAMHPTVRISNLLN